MATYLDLANLANDGSLLARIGHAIGKYAAYIFNEAPDATDHAKRLNWALKATANPPAMAAALVSSITRDANVVANLAAVEDTDLQTATETAANTLIGAPISYADLNALANDKTFLRRVQIAIAHFANYILNEAPSVANHAARYQWARTSILNTQGIANALAPAVVMADTVAAKLLGTSDAELQSAVEFEANQLLL
jgi:histone H3/H4